MHALTTALALSALAYHLKPRVGAPPLLAPRPVPRFHTAAAAAAPSVDEPDALPTEEADELLVELHLLSHQKQFKADALFAVGLRQVFNAFTRGYRPEEHLAPLFAALCSCNGFDAKALNKLADDSEKAVNVL